MRRSTTAAALALLCTLVLAGPAPALEQTLIVGGNDLFGASVALDGDTLVVGAPGDGNGRGAIYVFERVGDAWNQTGRLTASDGSSGDILGRSVAIDGETIVAGAPGATVGGAADEGSAYTFARNGAPDRTETAKLTPADGTRGVRFGNSVAIDGDTIVIGAPGDPIGGAAAQGAVYTFDAAGGQTAKLIASDGVAGARLGVSVAIDGETIVAGAPGDTVGADAGQGSVYTFTRSGSAAREETAKLTASAGAAQAGLGQAVAIRGDTIVAGAPSEVVAGAAKGALYSFTSSGAQARTESATLTASDGAAGDSLGFSVAIDATTILSGAPEDTVGANAAQGSVYNFAPAGAVARRQTGQLSDADGAAGDLFGFAIAADGDTTAVGAAVRGSVSLFFPPAPVAPPLLPPPPPPPPAPAPAPSVPVLSQLRLSTHKISFTLSRAAHVKLSFAMAVPGRLVGKRCARPTRPNRGNRRCIRSIGVGSFSVGGKLGPNAVAFAGRLPHRQPLRAGRYTLTATPTDASGASGKPRTTMFAIRAHGGRRRAR